MQKVDRGQLIGILNALRPAVSTRDIVEHADSFLFRDNVVWSYDDQVAISSPLPEGLSLQGVVLADPLLKLLDKMSDEQITIETEEDELKISTKTSHAGFPLKQVETFLVDAIPLPKAKEWREISQGLLRALSIAAPSAGRDMCRPILTYLSVADGKVVACDNFHITVCTVAGLEETLLLPATVVSHLSAFDPQRIGSTKHWIHFKNETGAVLSCRAGLGEYPDVAPWLKGKGADIVFPKEIRSILERASILSETEFTSDQRVLLSSENNVLKIEGKGPTGWFEESTKIESDAPFSFSVHPEYLLLALDFGRKAVIGSTGLRLSGKDFVHVASI